METDLIPASSPGRRSRIVTSKPCRSAQRTYMRISISAQSWDSVPPAPGMDGEQRVAGIVRALQHGLKLEGFDRRLELHGLAVQLGGHSRVRLLRQQLRHLAVLFSRLVRDSYGPTQPLSRLISCTASRAASALDQNAGSDCLDSRAPNRSTLAGRSKKVSQLGDPAIESGQTVGEIGHGCMPPMRCQTKTKR